MSTTPTVATPAHPPEAESQTDRPSAPPAVRPPTREPDLVADELLVEDVSIDGMCGVY